MSPDGWPRALRYRGALGSFNCRVSYARRPRLDASRAGRLLRLDFAPALQPDHDGRTYECPRAADKPSCDHVCRPMHTEVDPAYADDGGQKCGDSENIRLDGDGRLRPAQQGAKGQIDHGGKRRVPRW